jgi:hypothetical protein
MPADFAADTETALPPIWTAPEEALCPSVALADKRIAA